MTTKRLIAAIIITLFILPGYVLLFAGRNTEQVGDQEKAQNYFEQKTNLAVPQTKEDGSPYVVGYVDIDPYPASGEMLYYFIEQLADTGWITLSEELPFDPRDTDAKELINYLADRDIGEYLQFTRDANYYIAVDNLDECRRSLRQHAENEDLDLIFCLGTSPAELVIKELNITNIPVMVYFSVDPVGAGLSGSEEYSGQDNVWCHTSSDVYLNQIRFYHNAYPFQNIGMVYYNESVAAMNKYREAAEEIGFIITERQVETLTDGEDEQKVAEYYKMLRTEYQSLIKEGKIDAFMLNTDMIKTVDMIPELLDIFYEEKIPVFVQNGEYYVSYGALMVITASDAQVQAPFAVDAMAQILNGKKPGEIYQKFVASPYLSINLDAAQRLNYKVQEEYLLSAEKIYKSRED